MNLSMIAASNTMGQLQRKMDTISNNIANVNTVGYKRRESTFSDLLFQQVNNQIDPSKEVGRLTPHGIRVGSGAKIAQTAIRLEPGPVQQTERQLDLALTSKGSLFQIQVDVDGTPEVRYTRDGAFYLSPSATNPNLLNLVTANGDYVLGTAGPIMIPANFKNIMVNESGQVSVSMNNGAQVQAGQLAVVRAERPQMLEQVGENMFALPANLAQLGLNQEDIIGPGGQFSIMQGSLEMSNVDLGREMSELVMTQRSFEFNARSITMADQMSGLINSIRQG
ncbi:flagellar hook-basal body protein [Bacillus alkalicellulosilyticus]|uniref:flagellar hook-basal body protein n=1 Tax=Alkalihalobacterium alkalicellulosilyticum TaxID=1912214 RepID=UPI0009977E17|nr:flagellar hook-basal body protein [Bacillus alkalicellulosilyticus]